MDDSHISIDIDVKDGVSGPARVIITSLDDIGDKAAKAAPKVEALDSAVDEVGDDAAKTAARLTALEHKVKTLGNESIKSAAKMGVLKSVGGPNGIFDRLINGGKGGKSGKGGFAAMVLSVKFMRFFKLIMIPTILDAVGAVATLGSALTAMASAAVGALGPVVGLLGAIPSLLSSLVQGAAVLKLGFSGLGDAIKVLNNPEASPEELGKALENLGPKTQILAKRLADLQKPFANVKKAIGNDLAPGFIQLTNVARSYLPLLRKSLTETAKTISGMAGRMSNFMRSAGARSDLGNIMGANNTILKKLGTTVVPVFKALLNVMTAATPMVIRFVDEFAAFVRRISASTNDRKALKDFFEKTYTVTKGLVTVIADLSMALFNIFKQGASWGGEMGQSIMDLTAKFRNWTETAEGQQKITQWFEQMKPIVNEVAGIVVALAKGLASVSMDKTLVTTLQTIRTDTVPAIVALLQGTSGKFIEPLSRIIGTIASIMTEFKAFPVILDAMAKALQVIADIIQGLPGPIKNLLGYMVTLSSVIKFGGMIGFFSLFKGAGGGMLAAGVSNVAFAFQAVAGGAATAGEAVGFLGTSLKAALAPLWPLMVAAALAAIGISAWNAHNKMKEMHKTTIALNDELRRTGTIDSFNKVREQLDTLKADLADNQAVKDSIADLFNPSFWLRGDTWADSFKMGIRRVLGSGIKNPVSDWINKTLITSDEQRAGDIAASEKALRDAYNKNNQLANDLFGTDKSYSESSSEYKRITDIAEALGGLPENYYAARRAVEAYSNVNYKAAPAVRDLYNSIKTMGDAAADSATKTQAFQTALSSLQAILTGGGKRDQVIAIKRNMAAVNDGMKTYNWQQKLTAKNNWALNDALRTQASTITDLASAEYERTGDVDKATAAYREQYNTLKEKIIKGFPEGVKNVDAKAQKLLDKFMAAPKYMKKVFNDPNMLKMIEEGRISYEELRKYIKGHPLTPKVKINNKFKKGKWGLGGMSDVSQEVEATRFLSVKVKGEGKVKEITDSLLGLEARLQTSH